MTNGMNRNSKIAEHIFNGSITMSGVCVTIIALFRVLKTGISTYADEILSANTCIFLAAALLAYIAIKKDKNDSIEAIADVLFFIDMTVMMQYKSATQQKLNILSTVGYIKKLPLTITYC